MGRGQSGLYYTSNGSKKIHHNALIHALEGNFTIDPRTKNISRMINGGHGQQNIDFLKKHGFGFEINKTYENGVRVGNIFIHKRREKRCDNGQAWFPESWGKKEIIAAAEHISQLKQNAHKKDGEIMWGKYKDVRVGVIKTNGNIATIFPDCNQSDNKRRR